LCMGTSPSMPKSAYSYRMVAAPLVSGLTAQSACGSAAVRGATSSRSSILPITYDMLCHRYSFPSAVGLASAGASPSPPSAPLSIYLTCTRLPTHVPTPTPGLGGRVFPATNRRTPGPAPAPIPARVPAPAPTPALTANGAVTHPAAAPRPRSRGPGVSPRSPSRTPPPRHRIPPS